MGFCGALVRTQTAGVFFLFYITSENHITATLERYVSMSNVLPGSPTYSEYKLQLPRDAFQEQQNCPDEESPSEASSTGTNAPETPTEGEGK